MNDYKKILEGVVNIISSTTEKSEIVSNICSYIDENCPELKESEDERIRKNLKYLVENYMGTGKYFGIEVGKYIAWLKKQGEPKADPTFLFKVKYNDKEYKVRGIFGDVTLELYDKRESDPDHLIYINLDDCEIIKGDYDIKESGSPYPTKPVMFSNTFSEQGPVKVNKAEPTRFHPGDWVVCEDDCSVHQIKGGFENLNNHTYDYELTEGGHISNNDINKWHLWNFENDAKDGDILVSSDNQPFIFNGHFTSRSACGYCGITLNTFVSGDHMIWNRINKEVKPATREQRNILEKSMAEAGYTFDFDKKELNKITKFKIGD